MTCHDDKKIIIHFRLSCRVLKEESTKPVPNARRDLARQGKYKYLSEPSELYWQKYSHIPQTVTGQRRSRSEATAHRQDQQSSYSVSVFLLGETSSSVRTCLGRASLHGERLEILPTNLSEQLVCGIALTNMQHISWLWVVCSFRSAEDCVLGAISRAHCTLRASPLVLVVISDPWKCFYSCFHFPQVSTRHFCKANSSQYQRCSHRAHC